MPVRRTKRVCGTSARRRTKRTTLSKRRSKRFGFRKSRSRRSMKGGEGSMGNLKSVKRLIENAMAKGQSGGTYGSSLYPNIKKDRLNLEEEV